MVRVIFEVDNYDTMCSYLQKVTGVKYCPNGGNSLVLVVSLLFSVPIKLRLHFMALACISMLKLK